VPDWAAPRDGSHRSVGVTPNTTCPTPDACPELERLRIACESGAADSCTLFVKRVRGLLPSYSCDHPAIWGCAGASLAYRTLYALKSLEARRLFGSPEFRSVLSGEDTDHWPRSIRVQRQLVVGDGEANGPGPFLPVPFALLKPVASASSTLGSPGKNRYDPGLAFDGLPFTAWCEGVPGSGVGEWLELSLGSKTGRTGSRPFRAFHVVPGYAKTQRSYLANGAPTRLRITSCANPDASFEAELPLSSPLDFNAAVVSIRVPDGALKGEGRCARFTILAVREGGTGDTCISEITPSY